MKKALILVIALSLFGAATAFGAAEQEYPARDITNVLVWSAGGGTDTCNRVVMAEMANVLDVNINVINVTGGVGGSVGMLEAYSRDHDGYTLAGLSESIVTAGVQGGWDERVNVWDYFIIGGSPDVVSVTPDAPFQTIEELAAYIKANPGELQAGASAAGSIHHLNLLAFEKGTGGKFNYIPYDGSAPSQNAAMTGEISVVITSVAEQAQLIRGGQLRPLAVLIPDDFQFGSQTFPSAFKTVDGLDEYLPISQAIGFAVAKDTPVGVKQVLWDAFDEAMATSTVQTWLDDNFYVGSGATGDVANEIFDKLESNFAWTLWDLGAAKVDPATLGIPQL